MWDIPEFEFFVAYSGPDYETYLCLSLKKKKSKSKKQGFAFIFGKPEQPMNGKL